MTRESASQHRLREEPRFSIDILRSLRAEIDSLLGFLQSDSRKEKGFNEARTPGPPTQSLRRGHAERRARARTDGGASNPPGSAPARDCKSVGNGGGSAMSKITSDHLARCAF